MSGKRSTMVEHFSEDSPAQTTFEIPIINGHISKDAPPFKCIDMTGYNNWISVVLRDERGWIRAKMQKFLRDIRSRRHFKVPEDLKVGDIVCSGTDRYLGKDPHKIFQPDRCFVTVVAISDSLLTVEIDK